MSDKILTVEAAPGVIVRFPRDSAAHNRGMVLHGEGAQLDVPKSDPVDVVVDQFVRGRLRAGDLLPVAKRAGVMASSPSKTFTA
jgi:hypothetical protein